MDWVENKTYWTDASLDKIMRVNLDKTNPEIIVNWSVSSRSGNPTGIAVNPYLKKLFFTVTGSNPGIYVADLDGKNVKAFPAKNLKEPSALTIDFIENKLYWGDIGTNSIWVANLNGSDIQVRVIYLFY